MSNRVDFFQPEQTAVTIPAARFTVFVDGVLCSELDLEEIIQSQWPDFTKAKLVVNSSEVLEVDLKALENIVAMGKPLSIRTFYNGTIPENARILSYSIFEGQIEKSEIDLNSCEKKIEIVARDFSAAMGRVTIYGQRVINNSNTIYLQGCETVFNPNGKANASNTEIEIHCKSYKVFSPETNNARLWKYADVIQYLLNEYVTAGQLHIPSKKRLLALTEKQVVRDLDVTGLSLIDALQRCCERIGLRFKFVPTNRDNMPRQAIVFYKDKTSRKVEINYPESGQVNISKTNVVSIRSKKNYWPVTNRYIGLGDFKVYEATLELIKAWDGSLEGNLLNDFSPSTNPEFYKVRDVFRKWTLNEAGDYTGEPYNRGDAFDFSGIFQSNNYAQQRRRFYPSLTTDSQNRSLGYYLQVSYDNGLTWWQYRDAYNILIDECGVWLSSDQLNIDLIIASMSNNLKFRITASVISDERISAVIANGPVNSVIEVVDHVVTLPRQFKYQKVSDQSIFAGIDDNRLGKPNEIDDSEVLYEFVRHYSDGSDDIVEEIEIQTPVLAFNYSVGDIVISNPESSDIFSNSEGRYRSIIEHVQMDFQKQCTNLKINRKKII